MEDWIKEQRRHHRASRQSEATKPVGKLLTHKHDPMRPTTMAMERGQIHWRSVKTQGQRPRWVREAQLGSPAQRSNFYNRVLGEHFGLIIILATRKLRKLRVVGTEHTARLLGTVGQTPDGKVVIDPTSPTFFGIQRAVNSYDPQKGCRFTTWLRECLDWEFLNEGKKIIDEVKERRGHRSTAGHEEQLRDTAEGADAEAVAIKNQELLADWKARQEDRIIRTAAAAKAADRPAIMSALTFMQVVRTLDQARAFVVRHQSEGHVADYAEPVFIDTGKPHVSTKERQGWIKLVDSHEGLTEHERLVLRTMAPDGDLANMIPIGQLASQLHKDHPQQFPDRPSKARIATMVITACQKLSGSPEFDAMKQKLSPIDKAILVLREAHLRGVERASAILSKAAKFDVLPGHKYLKREGTPGSFRYYYQQEGGPRNIVRATNAPEGHADHDPALGTPEIHKHEPDPRTRPDYFDPRNGRKLHRPAPPDAIWNQQYDPDKKSRSSWAATWMDKKSKKQIHAYYDEDFNHNRPDKKFTVSNQHFDQQLPKVRRYYGGMMKSKFSVDRALGLMIALIDQTYMRAGKEANEKATGSVAAATMKVGNVKIENGRAIFSYGGKSRQQQRHVVRLDERTAAILDELMQGKGKNDYLFSVPVQNKDRITFKRVSYQLLVRSLSTFNVTPKQFRTYHGTEKYSTFFEQGVEAWRRKSPGIRFTPDILNDVKLRAATKVAALLGHYRGEGKSRKVDPETTLKSYIDPAVVQKLFINALNEDGVMRKALEIDLGLGGWRDHELLTGAVL